MMSAHRLAALVVMLVASLLSTGRAGMPSTLPTYWTAGSEYDLAQGSSSFTASEARWQAISFFLAVFLASVFGVRFFWNALRRDVAWMPALSFGRAAGMVALWGLLFVIVLTMISGARELMTPGAWRKQGWTYTLAQPAAVTAGSERRESLERLKIALWQYAADHARQFPARRDDLATPSLWNIPGWGDLQYTYVAGQTPAAAGLPLVFEPELFDERMVLFTNGVVASLSTIELERLCEPQSRTNVAPGSPSGEPRP